MRRRIFTRRQIIEKGTAELQEAGIEEAALDAWYLLEYVTGISRAQYYGDPDKEIDHVQADRYLECIQMRKGRVPLQHITGEQEFMGYSFFVNEHVLIPRQDTETLVEEAVKAVQRTVQGGIHAKDEGIKVLDMCTGSGCILLSMLKLCPGISGVGCDISEAALAVARKNEERLKVHADWVWSDLFRGLDEPEEGGYYDVIVSNPPYIRTAELEELQEEVRFHDPRIALDGREDGLYFYRKIIEESILYIKDGGSLLFEIGYDQGEAVAELMKRRGYSQVSIKKDLSGLDRVVKGVYNRKDGMQRR